MHVEDPYLQIRSHMINIITILYAQKVLYIVLIVIATACVSSVLPITQHNIDICDCDSDTMQFDL